MKDRIISWWFFVVEKSLSGKSLSVLEFILFDTIILIFQPSWNVIIFNFKIYRIEGRLYINKNSSQKGFYCYEYNYFCNLENTPFFFFFFLTSTIYSSWKLAWDNDRFVKCWARKSLVVHLFLMNCKIWTVTLF